MPRDDDYGFWTDERDRSYTGPIPRLSRAPRPYDGQPNFALRRIAVLVAVGVVVAPIAMLVGGSDDQPQRVSSADVPVVQQVIEPAPAVPAGELTPGTVVAQAPAASMPVAASATSTSPVAATASSTAGIIEPATTAEPAATAASAAIVLSATPSSQARAEMETVAAVATAPAAGSIVSDAIAANQGATVDPTLPLEPNCTSEYEVVPGDYWIQIADKVSVRLSDVLAANGANVDTALYPGRTICLPANASAPTTAAATTTDAPTSSAKATTTTVNATTTTLKATNTTTKSTITTSKTTSTTAPSTAQAPSTTAAPPKNTYTRAQVEQIIRDVWPDDLEDEAIRIATRESNLIPTVRNSCCFGLFQLHWNAHIGLMASSGVTSSAQLYDPRVNSYLAFAMYLAAGGWGPWD